jgi:hypothetical protein
MGELYAGMMRSSVFLIEEIESPKAHLRDFFFFKSDFVMRCGILRRRNLCRINVFCGCAAR